MRKSKKRGYIRTIIILSVLLFITSIVTVPTLLIIFSPMIVSHSSPDGNVKVDTLHSHSLFSADTALVAPPNPNKLYLVGYTPKTSGGYSYSGTPTKKGYLMDEHVKFGGGPAILLKIDTNTRAIYPNNRINNLTNLVYLNNAKEVHLFFFVNPKNLNQYRYRILINDTTELVHWQQPKYSGPTKEPYTKLLDSFRNKGNAQLPEFFKEKDTLSRLILLDKLNAKNKEITLQLYNLKNPTKISTVILQNKPFKKPEIDLIQSTLSKKEGLNRTERSVNLFFDSTFITPNYTKPKIYINQLTRLRIRTKQITPSYFYKVRIKNISSSKLLQLTFNQNKIDAIYFRTTTSSYTNFTINNPRSIFKKPGTYKISIVPVLPDYHNLAFKDKATSVEFTILPPKGETKTFSF